MGDGPDKRLGYLIKPEARKKYLKIQEMSLNKGIKYIYMCLFHFSVVDNASCYVTIATENGTNA